MKSLPVVIDDVRIPAGRRNVDPVTVSRIADSIGRLGLRTPITVRDVPNEGLTLVAGAHRLAAAKRCGMTMIPAFVMPDDATEIDARLWEIAENLDRAELDTQERSDHLAEWIRLTDAKRSGAKPEQVAQVSGKGGRGVEGGVSAAARELGVTRDEARRAVKIASIPEPVKMAAKDAGLSDNQSALLKIARAENPAEKLAEIVEQRESPKPSPQHDDDHAMLPSAAEWAATLEELEELRRIVEADDRLSESLAVIVDLRATVAKLEADNRQLAIDRNEAVAAAKRYQRALRQ